MSPCRSSSRRTSRVSDIQNETYIPSLGKFRKYVSVACQLCPVSRTRLRALRVLASLEGSLRKLRFLRCIPVRHPHAPAASGAIRIVILRRGIPLGTRLRSACSLPYGSRTPARGGYPCLTCASRRLTTNRVRPSHSARHGPQPSRFLSRHSLLCWQYIRFYRSFFLTIPSLRTVCGTFLRSRPRRIDTVARSPLRNRGGHVVRTIHAV